MIVTKTPYRISLFGGGTDYPIWFRENGGSVLSMTIDKYLYISCRYLPQFFEHNYRFTYSEIEQVNEINSIKHPAIRGVLNWMKWEDNKGIEMHYDGDLPSRSGVGSSSSFTVGLINALLALQGIRSDKYKLAQDAIFVEQEVIKENVGSQDQVAVSYGGLNNISFFGENNFTVNPMILPPERYKEIESHALLVFTGLSRYASEIASSQIKNIKNNFNQLTQIKEIVSEATDILNNKNKSMGEIGSLLHETWKLKKSLAKEVTTPTIDSIYNKARSVGAIGGKILGAGGGGFILLWAPPEHHKKIKKELSSLIFVPINLEFMGSTVALYQPHGL